LEVPAKFATILSMDPILRVDNLTVKFGDDRIIDNLSFELEKGESLAIIGPNGSGKTVLLRALLGIIPHEGEISWSEDAKTAYVPQKIDMDRKIPLNVMNLLQSKAQILKIEKREISSLIHRLNIPDRLLLTPVGHLSSGQMQRALIAFALLGGPNVILFDEPTASMDTAREEQTYELIHRLQDEFNVTPIVVSHDLNFVSKYSTRVLCLNHKGLCFGEPHEVMTKEMIEKLYHSPQRLYHHIHDHK
jgi:zinc transport system ATP-binding protein